MTLATFVYTVYDMNSLYHVLYIDIFVIVCVDFLCICSCVSTKPTVYAFNRFIKEYDIA